MNHHPHHPERQTNRRRPVVLGWWAGLLALVLFQAVQTPLQLVGLHNKTNNNHHHPDHHGNDDATTTTTTTTPLSSVSSLSNNNPNSHHHRFDARRFLRHHLGFDHHHHRNPKETDDDEPFETDLASTGLASHRPRAFFDQIRRRIDDLDPHVRCSRYGFAATPSQSQSTHRPRRRIFYGALVASEPWELMRVVGAETYGLLSGVVLVEANRTQSGAPRPWRWSATQRRLRRLFGTTTAVDVRQFRTASSLRGLEFEHAQRDDILRGWKALGMRPDDIGILADADEVLSRDFLQALRQCPNVPGLEWVDADADADSNTPTTSRKKTNPSGCRRRHVGIRGQGLVFEASPECITHSRVSKQPSALPGFCIQGIGEDDDDEEEEEPATTRTTKQPRPNVRDANGLTRAKGFGGDGDWSQAIATGYYPKFNGADFRKLGGHYTPQVVPSWRRGHLQAYTAFHFHNFFAHPATVRFKYASYGHANPTAARTQPWEELHKDLQLASRCVQNQSDRIENDDPQSFRYQRLKGGFDSLLPNRPVYFEDPDYRRARHELVRSMIEQDEREYGSSSSSKQ